jgi:hypothetical protein
MAMHAEGLDKRKQLVELTAYGCIQMVEGNVPVKILEKKQKRVQGAHYGWRVRGTIRLGAASMGKVVSQTNPPSNLWLKK